MGTTEAEPEFQALLRRAVDVAGQKQAAAKAIGVTPARFSKLFHNAPGSYTLGVRNCFRLAALLGETPQIVLRAVGKADIADALDDYARSLRTVKAPRQALLRPPDPLVEGLAEVVHRWDGDRGLLVAWANSFRALVGLPPVEETPVRRRARAH